MARICLVTTSQPSANPRLVKEADALVGAGHDVHVVGAHWVDWATDGDAALVTSRGWSFSFVDWRKRVRPALWWSSRFRQHAARRLCDVIRPMPWVAEAALTRIAPELAREVRRHAADLYIAHNLGALPIAIDAARRVSARVGFDAEDFHSGQLSPDSDRLLHSITEAIERRALPKCDYVTAAAPLIADAYAALCHIPTPDVVLNVFSTRHRPPVPSTSRDGQVRLYWFSQTIGPDRGLEDAVAALGLLRDPRVALHLRGRWQEGYEPRLRRLASDAGVASEQIVSHPPANPDAMVSLAADMDIGLALEPPASRNNDILWSNKAFTYLLGGTPVVLSRTTGQSRLAQLFGDAALTYAPGDARELAIALERWTKNPRALSQARSLAWRLGDERYNWEVEAPRFLTIVSEVLERGPRAISARSTTAAPDRLRHLKATDP
jgi:glycosyltransferase involved in cell wall biosynthesis